MIQTKCIQKFRDVKGKIYGYRLVDLNGQTQDVQPDNLKQAIRKCEIHVVNLTLTSDGRLVDKQDDTLKSKKLGESPLIKQSREDQFFEALMKIEQSFCEKIGGGDPGCCRDLNKSANSVEFTDQILGVYYPEEYHGNRNDNDKFYGITVSIRFTASEKNIWIGWQGDNGMGVPCFSVKNRLDAPLYSKKNIDIISNAFTSFYKKAIEWLKNDKALTSK